MARGVISKRNGKHGYKRRRKHRREVAAAQGNNCSNGGVAAQTIPRAQNVLFTIPRWMMLVLVLPISALFLWAYWPALMDLVHAWETQPDYSHGYLVIPFAIYVLWARRDRFPGASEGHSIPPAIALFGVAASLRYVAALYYLESLDGWSVVFWFAGIAWLIGGWKWLRWSIPSIMFLFFMVPLPWRAERWLSFPLQRVATMISGWTLQCFGLPAVTEGNTILLGDQTLEVAQACSGMRIFVGIAALAFAYVALVRRSWWEKCLLILAVLPISLVANSARIVLTGLLYQYGSAAAAQKFSHDLAGWLMLPFAACLFALTLWYLAWVFPHTRELDVKSMIRHRASRGDVSPKNMREAAPN